MLNVTYQTSYHGAWYAYERDDAWTTCPSLYTPGSYYGTGSLTLR